MKALVTGGAGFIGSHLAEALCHRGAQVTVFDNLSSGSLVNLAWRKPGDEVDLVQGDIRDESLVRKLVADCDWVFHKAALPSVGYSVAHPAETDEINSTATLKLLIAARDADVRRFVFASSSAVYGDTEALPLREQLPVEPISPYGLQKYAGERYTQLFHRLYGMPTVAFRYFNVFGPRQSYDSPYSGVIAKFCTAMLHGQAPLIFGDGLQSRDFVSVENVVNANLRAAEATPDQVAGKVFNIATGTGTTLLQLVGEINRLTGQELVAHHQPPRAGDIRLSLADISAAQNAFGYEPHSGLQAGLGRTLDYYRNQEEQACAAPGAFIRG